VWTVNDPIEMAELLDMGVDALITDRPDVLKEVLASRGQWR
jgi:glycerophosphoryl diester phosphodiesterase